MPQSHKRKLSKVSDTHPPEESVPTLHVEADIEAVLKKYHITREEYEKRFFWHEGKIAIVK